MHEWTIYLIGQKIKVVAEGYMYDDETRTWEFFVGEDIVARANAIQVLAIVMGKAVKE